MSKPLVGLIMGSQSDWPTLKIAAEVLAQLDVPFESKIVSAHRTPDRMATYAKDAVGRGLKVRAFETFADVQADLEARLAVRRAHRKLAGRVLVTS